MDKFKMRGDSPRRLVLGDNLATVRGKRKAMTIHKNGAPDLWWGRHLVEMKRFGDRLSKAQIEWHRLYHKRHSGYPLVIHYNGNPDHFRVFKSFHRFNEWRDGGLPVPETLQPELNALMAAEYGEDFRKCVGVPVDTSPRSRDNRGVRLPWEHYKFLRDLK